MPLRNTLECPIFVNGRVLIREWDNSWLGQNTLLGMPHSPNPLRALSDISEPHLEKGQMAQAILQSLIWGTNPLPVTAGDNLPKLRR